MPIDPSGRVKHSPLKAKIGWMSPRGERKKKRSINVRKILNVAQIAVDGLNNAVGLVKYRQPVKQQ